MLTRRQLNVLSFDVFRDVFEGSIIRRHLTALKCGLNNPASGPIQEILLFHVSQIQMQHNALQFTL